MARTVRQQQIERQLDPNLLYARVKPLNKKRGLRVVRIHVSCLGRIMEGGNGIDKPIEWVQVREDQARILRTYRQDDQDPDAKEVFDVVTLEQRLAIDRAEEAARMAHMGIGTPQVVRPPRPRIIDARAGENVMPEASTEWELDRRREIADQSGHESAAAIDEDTPVVSEAPTLVAGAAAFVNDPAVVGRMQALQGLTPQQAPQRRAITGRPETLPATPAPRRRATAAPPPAPAEPEPEPEPALAATPTPVEPTRRRSRRASRAAQAEHTAASTAASSAAVAPPPAPKPSPAEAFNDGVDVNEALGNERVIDEEDVEP